VKSMFEQRHDSDDAIEATAAAWLAERDGGMSAADAAAFAQWRRQDPRHDMAVARLESTWRALQELKGFRPEARMHPDRDLLAGTRPRRPVWSLGRCATLGALAAALVFGFGWWFAHPGLQAPARYATTAAGFQRVLLDDGSVMALHAESEARVKYSASARVVELTRGEGHFTVVKDPSRPFWVQVGDVSVQAVGTAFNIRRSAQEVEVLVTEGQVKIERPARASRIADAELPNLAAGERALIPLARPKTVEPEAPPVIIERVPAEVIREALAWQGPRLVFMETPLAEVVAQFNRHNHVQLVLEGPDLAQIPVGGSFRPEHVEAFVRLLASDNDIEVDRDDPDRIVLRSRK
jgi:transmembrane sensor